MTGRIIWDEPIADYHASKRLSTSKLRDFASRGARFFAAKHVTRTSPPEDRDSDALIFGQVFEDIVQERGFNADGKLVVKPEGMEFRSKENKTWRDEHLAAGRVIIAQDDIDRAMAMREALQDNDTALQLIRACKEQPTLIGDYPGTPGIQSRPDWLSLEGCLASGFEPFSLDLKTTRSLAKLVSGRGVLEHGYHAQAALCCQTLAASNVHGRQYLLGCEKSLPFRVQVIAVPEAWLEAGWRWCERHLDRLAGHYASGEWPRVERELVTLPSFPEWADRYDADEDQEAA